LGDATEAVAKVVKIVPVSKKDKSVKHNQPMQYASVIDSAKSWHNFLLPIAEQMGVSSINLSKSLNAA
jgi:hypothetical protein